MRRAVFPVILMFILLLQSSCNSPKPGKGGVLSYDQMKSLMWDMTQADEYAAVYIKRDSTLNLQAETNRLYAKIFELHKTDSARFFSSFSYYKTHPDDYKILLDSLYALANRERENRFYINTIKAPVGKAQ